METREGSQLTGCVGWRLVLPFEAVEGDVVADSVGAGVDAEVEVAYRPLWSKKRHVSIRLYSEVLFS